jgi:DNA-binding transcriptional LysR family regulator
MYGDLIEACHAKGFAPRIVAEVGQMFTNVTMVAAGRGVSVVPASMRDIHREAVFYASIADAPQLRAPFTLVMPIGRANPTLDRFVAFAREVAAASASGGGAGESASTVEM